MRSLLDPRLDARSKRLAVVSAVALGAIYWLAQTSAHAGPGTAIALLGGWLLMPAVLLASLRMAPVRLALLIPSALVTLALALICAQAVLNRAPETPGWLLLLAGIGIGDLLGAWLWFGLLPLPRHLHNPNAGLRWTLIGVHVSLIVSGIALVALLR